MANVYESLDIYISNSLLSVLHTLERMYTVLQLNSVYSFFAEQKFNTAAFAIP